MKPGDVRTWSTTDRTYSLTRTRRPYVHDLCDAYNEANANAGRGGRWYVTASGDLRIATHGQRNGASE